MRSSVMITSRIEQYSLRDEIDFAFFMVHSITGHTSFFPLTLFNPSHVPVVRKILGAFCRIKLILLFRPALRNIGL